MKNKIFITISFILFMSIFFVDNAVASHLSQHPLLGKMFEWGMSQKQVETAIEHKIVPIQPNIYQGEFKFGEDVVLGKFIISNNGLEAMVIKTQMSKEGFNKEVEFFKDLYGEPSGSTGDAYQWLQDRDDTSIVVLNQEGNVLSVIWALRIVPQAKSNQKYGPDKFSVFSNVVLGISEKEFLENAVYFKPEKVPSDKKMGSVFYGADITFDMFPAEVTFEFYENVLDRIFVSVRGMANEKDELQKQYDALMYFMLKLYGEPIDVWENKPYWVDAEGGLIFLGYHSEMKAFTVMWLTAESLKNLVK